MFAFHCAIRKYGVASFDLSVIDECLNDEELSEREKHWIAQLETFGKGYNMTPGGEGGFYVGHIVSVETRAKLASLAKKRYVAGHGALMRSRRRRGKDHPFYGKTWSLGGPLSEATKKKISEARRGKKLSEEHKGSISAGVNSHYAEHAGPNKDKPWAESTRAKHSVLRHLKKKPVLGYDMAGTCVVTYLSIEDAIVATGLGWRTLTGNRKKYRLKYNDGITYKRSALTIEELKKRIKESYTYGLLGFVDE